MPHKNVVVPHWLPRPYRLEHQIVRTVSFHCPITSNRPARLDLDLQSTQRLDPFDHFFVHRDGGIRSVTLGFSPITPTEPFVDSDRTLVNVIPAQADQLADPEPCISRDVDHRRVGSEMNSTNAANSSGRTNGLCLRFPRFSGGTWRPAAGLLTRYPYFTADPRTLDNTSRVLSIDSRDSFCFAGFPPGSQPSLDWT